MAQRLIALFLLVWLAVAAGGPALAQEQDLAFKKVAVFPFAVTSKEPLGHLGEKVSQEIRERLKTDGYTPVSQEDLHKELSHLTEPVNDAQAQAIGRKLGADMVIWGALLKVGDLLSLEGHALDLSGRKAASTLKLTGTGLQSLSGLSRQMAQEMSLKIMGKERVARIVIKGNRRIEKDAILGAMQTREGETLAPARLREDLKAVYKMGYFTDVRLESSDTPEGRILTVLVQEKPAIREIMVEGNRNLKKDKILEAMSLKPFSVASEGAIKEDINKVQQAYREKGYYEAQISYELAPVGENEVNLMLRVNEGGKLAVKSIDFEGNKAFSSKELRKVMETKERGFFAPVAWITGAGKLNRDVLERDLEKVAAFYYNHGYIKAKIGDPKVDIKGNWIYVTIPVQEGPEYRVGKIDMSGELLEDKNTLIKLLKTPKDEVYSREVLQEDLTTLADFYADHGYANADIVPLVKEDNEKMIVDVTFDIHKGQKIYFERIDIGGNVKTRDKVVRRELRVYEQDLFSATNLKESIKNLRRLEYFEDVNFATTPGSAPDRMNLKITVKERPTGTFGLGAGYSTQDRLVGMVEVSQNNLFGRGQQVKISGIIGSISHRLRASFTEPYLFDRPLGLGIDAFNWERQYSEYTRVSKGGMLRLSHPLAWKYTRLFWMYRFENVSLNNLAPNAPPQLVQASQIHNTSATSFVIRRDSRDSLFAATKGSDNSLSFEMAGLGGDTAFVRYLAETGWYFPFKWNIVGVLHARAGGMNKLSWGQMPAYELFYLGGIDTIRGFKYAEISPRDPVSNDRIGGTRFLQFNNEIRFPLYKKLGLTGTVFFDAGNVYGPNYIGPFLRTSVGAGFRWFSPMGPLRVEWGYNLSKKTYERSSAWEFTMGGSF
ncbi:MAG: outer membrane protein assembly factor BamA [Deltaproteobacteria bacterium]|nr:outer membrane protein assembly factor BamA [Deltaproteobacteria bacterium]